MTARAMQLPGRGRIKRGIEVSEPSIVFGLHPTSFTFNSHSDLGASVFAGDLAPKCWSAHLMKCSMFGPSVWPPSC